MGKPPYTLDPTLGKPAPAGHAWHATDTLDRVEAEYDALLSHAWLRPQATPRQGSSISDAGLQVALLHVAVKLLFVIAVRVARRGQGY